MIELFDKNMFKILTIFSISPGARFNRKFLKEKTGMPNLILDKTLFNLINLKILAKEKNLFSFNFKNTEIKNIADMLAENYNKLKQLPLKEYFMIMEITNELAKIKGVEDMYLFGSYTKLIFTKSSDIDIAVVSDSFDKKRAEKVIRKLERRYKKTIEIHDFTRKFYKNKKDSLVKEILQHGVKLI